MSIFLGSDSIVRAFYTVPNSVPLSGSTTQIVSSSYISGAVWPSLTGSAVDTINAPFAGQAPDGKWQLNVSGTICNNAKYLIFSSSLFTGKYAQTRTQPFTILFNGTLDGVGSNGVSRYGQGLFGNPMYTAAGTACDIIIRTDTTQSGFADIDWRSSRAGSGEAARFTIECVSGSVYNLAFVKDSSQMLKMYQNGVLIGSASSLGWVDGFNLFATASVLNDTSYRGMQFGLVASNGCGSQDTFAYQGKLGAIALYNRELSQVEIQQASQAYNGLQNGQGYALPISSSYLGSDLVYVDVPPTTTTTTTTTTTSTTTTSTTTTTTAAPTTTTTSTTTTTAAPSLLLDTYTGSRVAYSLRKLRTAYAGSAVRVRRSNDNSEQDIGFVGENFDTGSLATFVGANSAYVTKWYDQSGGARDAAQTTAANQPRIVNAGTIETENGKTAVNFGTNSNNWWLDLPTGALAASNLCSYFQVARVNTFASSNAGVFGPSADNSKGLEVLQHDVISTPSYLRLNNNAKNSTTNYLWTNNAQGMFTFITNASSTAAWNNASSVTLSSTSAMGTLNFTGVYALGRYAGGSSNVMSGEWQELVIYQSDETSNRTGIQGNINTYYAIY